MRIFTSYFSKVGQLPKSVVPISISIWPPKGWAGAQFRALAPTKEILLAYKQNGDWGAYVEKYNRDVLSKLNPHDVVAQLEQITGGRNAVLVCFEREPVQCHRTLVANWLKAAGYPVAEVRF